MTRYHYESLVSSARARFVKILLYDNHMFGHIRFKLTFNKQRNLRSALNSTDF